MARNRMVQNATVETVTELQPEQQLAIAALLSGATDEAAATAAGVSRASVVRWKMDDAAFIAELNKQRVALWYENLDGLRALVRKSLAVVASALDSDDERLRLQAALRITSSAGELWGALFPKGPTTKSAAEREKMFTDLL